MNNLDALDGYEFEDVIYSLFSRMGFAVEHTALSGDGGVDIIAKYDEDIFRGKYLIQCKRYTGKVGEPAIRDLYGAVMSANANKGILVTNSFFSMQALNFAEGKNIELIDGDSLNKLLMKWGVVDSSYAVSKQKKSHYTNNDNFDIDRYQYLKKLLSLNKKEIEPHEALFSFLYNYLVLERDTLYDELISECLALSDEILRKFIKNTKKLDTPRRRYTSYSIALLIMQNNIEKAAELMKLSNSYHGWGINYSVGNYINKVFSPIHYTRNSVLSEICNNNDFVKLRNLLVCFAYNDYTEDADKIINNCISSYEKRTYARTSLVIDNFQLFVSQSKDIMDKKDTRIYLPHPQQNMRDHFAIYSSDCYLDYRDIVEHNSEKDIKEQLRTILEKSQPCLRC